MIGLKHTRLCDPGMHGNDYPQKNSHRIKRLPARHGCFLLAKTKIR